MVLPRDEDTDAGLEWKDRFVWVPVDDVSIDSRAPVVLWVVVPSVRVDLFELPFTPVSIVNSDPKRVTVQGE